jgi:phosphosulfolactate synthase
MDIKAWDGIFRDTRFERNIKPRVNGINMVLDKNLGMRALADLLETAGDSIDYIKFAYGTSVALNERVVREKIKMVRAHQIQVFPGGTLLEAAIVQDVLPDFLKRACELGFSMIEVSDGTITLPQQQRAEVIHRALDLGFQVISEVGKKDPRQKMPVGAMQAQIGADLAHGAKYVIIEAREGGKGVGIYDEDGAVDEAGVDSLVNGLEDLERIVWEAPQCAQEAYLISRFGANVNLGNIPPLEVLALEALRCGFRFETLRHAAKEQMAVETKPQIPASVWGNSQTRS